MRKTGQTTRLVNHYIQKMIDNPGQSYQIVDHYNDVHNNSILVKRIEHRLQYEYSNDIDISHSMDNYGVTATGTNKMSVRYSPYVLLDRDIFIGRVVDEVIESLFQNMNKQVNILEITQRVYKANPKMLFPTLNNDFCNKVITHTSGRFKYEHGITNIDNRLSSEYNVSKESLISQDNRYFVMTLYSNDFLEDIFSLNNNKTKTRIDDMELFSNVGVYNVDAAKVDNFDEYVSDCFKTEISSVQDFSGCITAVKDSINTFAVSTTGCVDVIDELKNEIEKLKNKDKYKLPDNEVQINKMNMFK